LALPYYVVGADNLQLCSLHPHCNGSATPGINLLLDCTILKGISSVLLSYMHYEILPSVFRKYLKTTNRVIHKMADIPVYASIDGKHLLGIIVVQIKQIRHAVSIIHTATSLRLLVRYHLQ